MSASEWVALFFEDSRWFEGRVLDIGEEMDLVVNMEWENRL